MAKHPSQKGALLCLANQLCREAGVAQGQKIKSVVFMATGKKMSQRDAWAWLRSELNRRKLSGEPVAREPGNKTPYQPSKRMPTVADTEKPKKTVIMGAEPSKTFFASDAWRKARFDALKASNGCCTLCGRSNRQHGVILHVDHIKPRSKFPKLALDRNNLQVLCEDCNMGKGNRDDTDWRTPSAEEMALDKKDWRYH